MKKLTLMDLIFEEHSIYGKRFLWNVKLRGSVCDSDANLKFYWHELY